MKKILSVIVVATIFVACQSSKEELSDVKNIEKSSVVKVKKQLGDKYVDQKFKIDRGVLQVANLWRQSNGNKEEFEKFCIENYISDENERELVFHKISRNLEALTGRFNQLALTLLEPLHLDIGKIHKIDHMFGAYNVGAHLWDDFYKNKIAFAISCSSTSTISSTYSNTYSSIFGFTTLTAIPSAIVFTYAESMGKCDS